MLSNQTLSLKFCIRITHIFCHCRATLDLNLRHISLEKKNNHDVHARKMREKERDLRNLKKAELQLRVADESLNHTKLIHEKIKSQVTNLIDSFKK